MRTYKDPDYIFNISQIPRTFPHPTTKPMKRIGEGGDSASVAKFLLMDESSWITGQIIGVDGGRSSVA